MWSIRVKRFSANTLSSVSKFKIAAWQMKTTDVVRLVTWLVRPGEVPIAVTSDTNASLWLQNQPS
jgi:hypothetical protein